MSLSRRTLLASSTAAAATGALVLAGCDPKTTTTVETGHSHHNAVDAANKVLEQATDLMVNFYPETASSAGIDKGKYAGLK